MTFLVKAPSSLDHQGFERLLSGLQRMGEGNDKEVGIDISLLDFVDPYGMLGILSLGSFLRRQGRSPFLHGSISSEVESYLDRMDFFAYAADVFAGFPAPIGKGRESYRKRESDVLLEITGIENSDDIHAIVGRVKGRGHKILRTHLHYDERAVHAFIVALSEVCQNIPEHSQATGFVGIQKYFFHKRLGKNAVKIAVMDLGIGINASLAPKFSPRFGSAWTDLVAIEQAFFHEASRYHDPGRGQGLAAVRRFVQEWQGALSLRSGSAKISLIPSWGWGKARETPLPFFPGTQVSITLPEI